MKIATLSETPIKNKTVLVRVDYNVPFANGKIQDNKKIEYSLPTIKLLLQNNCKVILATHLGEPPGKVVSELSTKPLAKELQKFLPKHEVVYVDDCLGEEIKRQIGKGTTSQIFLLENLRFYKEESANDPAFAHSLASLAEIYINDAFASSHRAHASVEAITHFLPSLAGLHLEQEITYLSKALHPQHPCVWLLGGAKLKKVELINHALDKADYILIGGALAFAFLKAKGIPVGMSRVDRDSVQAARTILHHKNAAKIILPVDFVVTKKFSRLAPPTTIAFNHFATNQIGLDLGEETIKLFKQYLRKAHTIVWNGPLGYFEWTRFSTATRDIARFISKLTATTICGGGETAEAIHKYKLEDKITHISSGGGASLEFLAGNVLPGLHALERNNKKFASQLQKLKAE